MLCVAVALELLIVVVGLAMVVIVVEYSLVYLFILAVTGKEEFILA
jgi:hypothetical protein